MISDTPSFVFETCACLSQDFFYEPVVGLSDSPLGLATGLFKVRKINSNFIFLGAMQLVPRQPYKYKARLLPFLAPATKDWRAVAVHPPRKMVRQEIPQISLGLLEEAGVS